MSVATILLPLFVQVALTFVVLFMTARSRIAAYKARQVNVAEVAVNPTAWPVHVQQIANCYNNQFQLPVLFYVAATLAFLIGPIGWPEALLVWAFVALRYVHAFIHVTTNHVVSRFAAYAGGLAVLALFWLWLVIRILMS